jgi:hypothetical protein
LYLFALDLLCGVANKHTLESGARQGAQHTRGYKVDAVRSTSSGAGCWSLSRQRGGPRTVAAAACRELDGDYAGGSALRRDARDGATQYSATSFCRQRCRGRSANPSARTGLLLRQARGVAVAQCSTVTRFTFDILAPKHVTFQLVHFSIRMGGKQKKRGQRELRAPPLRSFLICVASHT